jgi:chromobox protein 1
MPPPLVEDEESSADEIPFKDATENGADEAGDDEASDGDDAPDEYIVEKILQHDWLDDDTLTFEVKWQGYDDPADHTWEPEENLKTAADVLKAYFKKIGGHPGTRPAKAKKSRKRSVDNVDTPKSGRGSNKKGKHDTPEVAPISRKKKVEKGVEDWKPPPGSWENEIVDVDTIEETFDAADGVNKRWAYVVWNNGRKSRHQLPTLNQKCPQKMIQYYENHLVFRNTNGTETQPKAEE